MPLPGAADYDGLMNHRLLTITFAVLLACPLLGGAQVVLVAPDRIVAVSASSVTLDVRCEQIPISLAAALIVQVSTPAFLPPEPTAATVSGLPPTVSVNDASGYMTLRFAGATGAGLTELKSRILLTVGDENMPGEIHVLELRYVPSPGPSVISVPIHGLKVVVNEAEEE